MSFLRLLRDRWVWWVVPLVVLTAATVALTYFGQSEVRAPYQYDVPTK